MVRVRVVEVTSAPSGCIRFLMMCKDGDTGKFALWVFSSPSKSLGYIGVSLVLVFSTSLELGPSGHRIRLALMLKNGVFANFLL